MKFRYLVYLALVGLAIAIQGPLWFGKGGISRMHALEAELSAIRAANERLRVENDTVAAEIESLESGSGAVEERARMRLGMIRDDEVLVRLVPKGNRRDNAEDWGGIVNDGTQQKQIFAPKRADLYSDGTVSRNRYLKRK